MAMTNAEKQAAWRARRDQYVKDLELQYKQAKELERQDRHIKKLEQRVAELEAARTKRIAELEAEVERLRNHILGKPRQARSKAGRKGPKDIPPTVGAKIT